MILLRIIDRDYERFIRVDVYSSVSEFIMEISLDNPGFSVDTTDAEVHFSDPPKSSGSSTSASGESTRRSCKKCHGRMSSFSLDKHLFCIKCRGSDCSLLSRCDECMQCTKEEMESYMKLRRSLSSKSKRSKSSPPRSTPHDSDVDISITAQLDSISKSVDQKIEAMSVSLLSKFSSMLESFQPRLNSPSFPDPSAVSGHSACLSEPPSRRPTVSTKSPAGLRFQKGGDDPVPHEDELVSARVIDETPETLRHPPGDGGEPQGIRCALAFVKHHQAGAAFDSQPADRAYNRLMHYIHKRFPHLQRASAPHVLLCCEFEEFFATSEAPPSAKPNLTLYPLVDEILDSCADRASRFARESKPLHRVLLLKRQTFHVGDQPDFCSARFVNPDFS